MALDRASQTYTHGIFADLPSFLSPGDVVVLNDIPVSPLRILGSKSTGGRVELLLLSRGEGERWRVLTRPWLREGAQVVLAGGVSGQVVGRSGEGECDIQFSGSVDQMLQLSGRMPLPPYVRRAPQDNMSALDKAQYQTVYAQAPQEAPANGEGYRPVGAVAAPTAGLHFTEELLETLRRKGVHLARIQLWVGWGTFRPLRGPLEQHHMLPEAFELSPQAAETLNQARQSQNKIWAVGTTVTRVLETTLQPSGRFAPARGHTNLFITPGYRFQALDGLITNFHLPGHTPLLLAAAFAGTDFLRRAYQDALSLEYRFFSYGDAMLIR